MKLLPITVALVFAALPFRLCAIASDFSTPTVTSSPSAYGSYSATTSTLYTIESTCTESLAATSNASYSSTFTPTLTANSGLLDIPTIPTDVDTWVTLPLLGHSWAVYAFTVPVAFMHGFQIAMVPQPNTDVDIMLYKTRPDINSCGISTGCTADAYTCPDVLGFGDIPWAGTIAYFSVTPDMLDGPNQLMYVVTHGCWGGDYAIRFTDLASSPQATRSATASQTPTASSTPCDSPTGSPMESLTTFATRPPTESISGTTSFHKSNTASTTPSVPSSPTGTVTRSASAPVSHTHTVTRTASALSSRTGSLTRTASGTSAPTGSITRTATVTSSPTHTVTRTARASSSPRTEIASATQSFSSRTCSATGSVSPTPSVERTNTIQVGSGITSASSFLDTTEGSVMIGVSIAVVIFTIALVVAIACLRRNTCTRENDRIKDERRDTSAGSLVDDATVERHNHNHDNSDMCVTDDDAPAGDNISVDIPIENNPNERLMVDSTHQDSRDERRMTSPQRGQQRRRLVDDSCTGLPQHGHMPPESSGMGTRYNPTSARRQHREQPGQRNTSNNDQQHYRDGETERVCTTDRDAHLNDRFNGESVAVDIRDQAAPNGNIMGRGSTDSSSLCSLSDFHDGQQSDSSSSNTRRGSLLSSGEEEEEEEPLTSLQNTRPRRRLVDDSGMALPVNGRLPTASNDVGSTFGPTRARRVPHAGHEGSKPAGHTDVHANLPVDADQQHPPVFDLPVQQNSTSCMQEDNRIEPLMSSRADTVLKTNPPGSPTNDNDDEPMVDERLRRCLVNDADTTVAQAEQLHAESDDNTPGSTYLPTGDRRVPHASHEGTKPGDHTDVHAGLPVHAAPPHPPVLDLPVNQDSAIFMKEDNTVELLTSPHADTVLNINPPSVPRNNNDSVPPVDGRLRRRLVNDPDASAPQGGQLHAKSDDNHGSAYLPTRARRIAHAGHEGTKPADDADAILTHERSSGLSVHASQLPSSALEPTVHCSTDEVPMKVSAPTEPSTPPRETSILPSAPATVMIHSTMPPARAMSRRRLVDEGDLVSSSLHADHMPADKDGQHSSFSPSRARRQAGASGHDRTKTGSVIVDNGVMYHEDIILEEPPVKQHDQLEPQPVKHDPVPTERQVDIMEETIKDASTGKHAAGVLPGGIIRTGSSAQLISAPKPNVTSPRGVSIDLMRQLVHGKELPSPHTSAVRSTGKLFSAVKAVLGSVTSHKSEPSPVTPISHTSTLKTNGDPNAVVAHETRPVSPVLPSATPSSIGGKGMSSPDRTNTRRLLDEADRTPASATPMTYMPAEAEATPSSFSPSRARRPAAASGHDRTKPGSLIVDSGVMYHEDMVEDPLTSSGRKTDPTGRKDNAMDDSSPERSTGRAQTREPTKRQDDDSETDESSERSTPRTQAGSLKRTGSSVKPSTTSDLGVTAAFMRQLVFAKSLPSPHGQHGRAVHSAGKKLPARRVDAATSSDEEDGSTMPATSNTNGNKASTDPAVKSSAAEEAEVESGVPKDGAAFPTHKGMALLFPPLHVRKH